MVGPGQNSTKLLHFRLQIILAHFLQATFFFVSENPSDSVESINGERLKTGRSNVLRFPVNGGTKSGGKCCLKK
jgi:hypothetical protein